MTESNQDNINKLRQMLKGIRIGMLTTVDDEGRLHSRPMATQEQEFDGTLWFFTGISSAKAHEIERDHHVNISYASPEDNRYVSVSGMGRLVRDPAKAKQLWSPIHKAWFPKGLDDPELGLLQVDVDRAEYWDSPSSAVVQLVGFAKSILTGRAYRDEMAKHGKLNVS